MKSLYLALGAMFVQQTFATVGKTVVPIISPALVDELGISPALVGVYVALSSGAGILTTMGCGGFIVRYGPLRMTQVGLLMMVVGFVAGAPGAMVLLAFMSIAIGAGATVSTPASSHLLARYAPPKIAPLIFSIKQTAVPVGLMLSGLLGPFYVVVFGWWGAQLAVGAMCLALASALQPLRTRFDAERDPAQPLSLADFKTTFVAVTTVPALRVMSSAGFAFAGLQGTFVAFVVIFMARELGYSLTTAGFVFSTAIAVSIPARVLWGWIGSRFIAPRIVLAILGLVMTAAAFVIALFSPGWPVAGVIAVSAVFSATAISWHGVFLAEVARLAPAGKIGPMTGAVLSFAGAGQVALPLVFGGILGATGSYGLGFVLVALPALATGVVLVRRRPEPRPDRLRRKRIR